MGDEAAIGKRIALARRQLGLTQDALAQRVQVARSTLAEMETGARKVTAAELRRFSEALGKPFPYFFAPVTPADQVVAEHIASSEVPETRRGILARLQTYASNLVDLQRFSGIELSPRVPEYQIGTYSSPAEAARGIARQERQRLWLLDRPIENVRHLLEQDASLLVFGLDAHDPTFDGAMLRAGPLALAAVNVQAPVGRRNYTATHEYAERLVGKDVHVAFRGDTAPSPQEEFAERFASYFLVPPEALERAFDTLSISPLRVSPDDVLRLADYLHVSFACMAGCLRHYAVISPEAEAEYVSETRVGARAAELGLGPVWAPLEQLPQTYQRLAFVAHKKGAITLSRLAEFLELDALEARQRFRDWLAQLEEHAPEVAVLREAH